MLVSLQGKVQQATLGEDHWAMFVEVSAVPVLFDPLRTEVIQQVDAAILANQQRPYLDSRQIGAQVLANLTSWWHGEFPRRFDQFPNGAERGVFGMTLWNYLAGRPDWWCFSDQPDSHGYGQTAKQYWRLGPNDRLIPAAHRSA